MIQLTRNQKIAAVSVGMVLSFAAGRWSTPVKIKVETKTIEVEKKVSDVSVSKDRKVTKIVTTKPDGEKTETTIVDNSIKNDDKTIVSDIKASDKVVDKETSDYKTTINALIGLGLNNTQVDYGLSITRPVLGPLTIGVWGLSDKTGGASIGLTF